MSAPARRWWRRCTSRAGAPRVPRAVGSPRLPHVIVVPGSHSPPGGCVSLRRVQRWVSLPAVCSTHGPRALRHSRHHRAQTTANAWSNLCCLQSLSAPAPPTQRSSTAGGGSCLASSSRFRSTRSCVRCAYTPTRRLPLLCLTPQRGGGTAARRAAGRAHAPDAALSVPGAVRCCAWTREGRGHPAGRPRRVPHLLPGGAGANGPGHC